MAYCAVPTPKMMVSWVASAVSVFPRTPTPLVQESSNAFEPIVSESHFHLTVELSLAVPDRCCWVLILLVLFVVVVVSYLGHMAVS